ncbi:hypothetical protein [Rhizobium leguminosarum]|uniref:hypothetical protein n=1 Tax=Rhizobium leguminosarum TaxID=384 RepID=UPI0021BBC1B3|nr:hypothetical protein [Rhizobium leguminosarum]
MIKKDGKTAAEVRGRIQSGDSGDIRSGFDPAAAPLETDAEAAGQPMSHEEIETALHTQSRGAADRQRKYDVAIVNPGVQGPCPRRRALTLYASSSPHWLLLRWQWRSPAGFTADKLDV